MASICKIDGLWRALIRRKGHKPTSKRFNTKAQAEAWARKTETQIDSGATVKNDNMITVAALIEKYREMRELSPHPIGDTVNEHYILKRLSAGLGELVAAKVTIDDLVGWAHQRKIEGAGPYTINMDLSKLGTVYRYAGEGLPDVVGAARPRLTHMRMIGGGGRRERRPTEDELQRIVSWLADKKGQAYADAVEFAVGTAMRRGEVVRLKWADIDESKKLICIRDRKDPRHKIGNDQWVPLLGKSWDIAQRQTKTDERIFPIHEQTLSKYFLESCRALSIPDLHFHDLRHEGTSRLFEEGYEIQQVALVTGHKDWRHLKRYTNLKPEDLHRL